MRKLLLVPLLFMSVNCFALQLSDMETRIRELVDDPSTDTNKQIYSDTDLDFYINQGQREVCDITWCLYTSTTNTLSSGTTYFTLPSNCNFVDRVIINSTTILPKRTIPYIDRDVSTWLATADATPTEWYDSLPRTQIGFYPVTSVSLPIEVWYVVIPNNLSNDSDIPFNGVFRYYSYHDLLIDFACMQIFWKEGKLNHYQIAKTRYMEGLQRFLRHIGLSSKKQEYMMNSGGQR